MKSYALNYRVYYNSTLATKKTSKVIEAEIYNSGEVYPMVAEYSLFWKNMKNDTHMTEPTYAMRTYTLSRQFLALFCDTIRTSDAQPDQKQLDQKLRIIDGFPVNQDICYCPEEDDGSSWLGDRDMIELQGEDQEYCLGTAMPNLEAKPSRVFFFQEKIEGYRSLLSPDTATYNLTEESSTAKLLLHAFQHWVYCKTRGQMTVTNFKGNPPLITKPKLIDLNPK
ncbi:hypothetical protein PTTG_26934 [Puccinia triticina 1-1 BBBD Race 1]|uniref:Alpha-type protein kinase domain-containing protein n=1 Tax=Puccinia triticina (isolate 1-1 / race 1 (BBBD)) TaxID=630390 RepID=A0A180GPY3_PUCT1|nr:hypothetical protein PTTG_26934 [Puccinia triticina 1-1 BBBD Race 1]